jgi:DsbC/DsbD-like thiol-disulfide interchange protein
MENMKTGRFFSSHSSAAVFLASALILTGFISVAQGQSPPNISVNNYLTSNKVRKGRSVQGVVELQIPTGFHIHSNRPLEKFLIATQLQLEAPKGVRVGAVTYPRAILRSLKFSKNKVALYEGKVVLRFNLTVPASFSGDSVELKGRLRYQSCNDEVCFRPENRDLGFSVKVG